MWPGVIATNDVKYRPARPRPPPPPRDVGRVPGDDHAHHRRLARAGGHLGAVAHDAVVVLLGGVLDGDTGRMIAACHLGDPDQRLERLHLGEEQPRHVVLAAPMMQEPPRHGRRTLVAALTPHIHDPADLVDRGVEIVVAELENLLCRHVLPALGYRQQRDAGAATLSRVVERPIVDPQLPVPRRLLIRRVQHWLRDRINAGHVHPEEFCAQWRHAARVSAWSRRAAPVHPVVHLLGIARRIARRPGPPRRRSRPLAQPEQPIPRYRDISCGHRPTAALPSASGVTITI